MLFSHSIPSQLILKYAYTLGILIHHIVYMSNFDCTLPVLQNLEKTKCAKLNENNPLRCSEARGENRIECESLY